VRDRGFTLIEVTIALLLATLLLAGISMAFFRTTSEAMRLRDVTDRRQSARTAVQLMEREIRMAGSGWGRIPVYGNNSGGTPVVLAAVVPGYISVAADGRRRRWSPSRCRVRVPTSRSRT
jgi:prepilin-type N-terminal cleavage/methylation domain-containing protein